jgi:hypothetical protein
MSNTYNVAGFSTKNGKTSFRVANGSAVARTKVLERDGHTNIDLIDLPSAMTKEAAFEFASKAITVTGDVSNVAPKTSTIKVVKTKTEAKAILKGETKVEPKRELTDEEKAVKEKNLETMKAVSARLSKMRVID